MIPPATCLFNLPFITFFRQFNLFYLTPLLLTDNQYFLVSVKPSYTPKMGSGLVKKSP